LEKHHRLCILPPLNSSNYATQGNVETTTNNDVLCQLIEATNRNNKVCEETNLIRLKEYQWKKDLGEVKKDKMKDIHPSILQMIMHPSSSKNNQAGKLCKDFISLYNSKTHGGLDIKLRQLFENNGHAEVVFSKGVLPNIWAGILCRTHKAALGAFSLFLFSKMQPLSTNNEKDRSLLIEIFAGQRGGLMRNLDKVKASAKVTALVPHNYHTLVFQLEAYTLVSKYIFGESSILTGQLRRFVEKTKMQNLAYKSHIAGDKDFATKIILPVDEQVNLFLDKCRRCNNCKKRQQAIHQLQQTPHVNTPSPLQHNPPTQFPREGRVRGRERKWTSSSPS
jgi:hypothetical protein